MITKNTFEQTIELEDDNDRIDLREIFEKYYYYKKWFLLSLILTIGISVYYLKTTDYQYNVSATIFIDDEESGGLASELSAFEDLGVLTKVANKSVVTETGVLRSYSLMENVVEELNLNVAYYYKRNFLDSELYGNSIPIEIKFLGIESILSELNTIFLISPISETSFLLKDEEDNLIKKGLFGDKVMTDFGEIIISKTEGKNIDLDEQIVVKITRVKSVVNSFRSRLTIETESSQSSLLVLSLTDNLKQRAEEVLNSLVKHYINNDLYYKTKITANTDEFIKNRIIDISSDLTEIDQGVEEFKTKNELSDVQYEAGLVLQNNSDLQRRIIDLQGQIQLVEYVSKLLENNKDELIPANIGLSDDATNQNTLNYNRLLLERNRIIKSSSIKNPTVINLDTQISTLKQSIEQGLTNYKSSLNFSLKQAQNQENKLNAKIRNTPRQEREYQDILRRQGIVESLYLYLLEKREENAISMGIPVPNAKIIDPANGSDTPISPAPKLIYIAAILLGLCIPAGVISIISFLDKKIQTLEQLENILQMPILGDVPKTKLDKNFIVTDSDRSSIAESFRIIRTNLNYMFSGIDKGSKIIFVTSTIGNEGKTFIAINLASVFSSINKKVLVIGADLRKPKLKEYLKINHPLGLTDLLVDSNLSIKKIIFSHEKFGFDIVTSGQIPPNPSNLLMNNRFQEVLSYGEENYDYIIVDTAPLSLVTDTQIISTHADLFIYVVRANFLDKRLLKNSELSSKLGRIDNKAIILNQSDHKRKGYGYGYGYGS